jgi:hypothetical protein
MHERQLRSLGGQRCAPLCGIGERLAAERSAKVPQENHECRRALREFSEADAVLVKRPIESLLEIIHRVITSIHFDERAAKSARTESTR